MTARFPRKNKYIAGIFALVLVISLGLNLYDYFVTLPEMQKTVNNLRVRALQAWAGRMTAAGGALVRAKTSYDVREAGRFVSSADQFDEIFISGVDIWKPDKDLYYWVDRSTFNLKEDALDSIYFGNKTGTVTERDLDHNELSMIENMTSNIKIIESLPSKLFINGIEPTQQLEEAKILDDLLNALKRLSEISIDVVNYY